MRVRHPRRLDLLFPAAIALVGTVEILAAGYRPGWLVAGVFLLAAGVLAFARAAPLPVPVLVAVIYGSSPLLAPDAWRPVSWVPLLATACLSAGLYSRPTLRLAGLGSVVLVLAITLAGMDWFTDFDGNLLFGAIASVGSWCLGIGLNRALEQSRRAGERAERERLAAEVAVGRAVQAERDRIAVELPDLLAHSIGAMVLQASVCGDLISRDTASAGRVLNDVAQAGREGLVETGRLLRLLRDDRDELGLRAVAVDVVVAAPELPPRSRGIHSAWPDPFLPALFAVTGTIEIASGEYRPQWASLAALWLAAGLLAARRAIPIGMPVGVVAVAVGAAWLGANTQDPAAWILLYALASFSGGRYSPRSHVAWSAASALAAFVTLALYDAVSGGHLADTLLMFAGTFVPWAVGVGVREALDRARDLAAHAERARCEAALTAERTAAQERRRIARELHDLLANSLNVMIVQAMLAADLVERDVAGAGRAIAEVERCGRAALGETGRLLRLIHNGEEDPIPPPHRVRDIPALAAEYANTGLGVTVDLDDLTRLPASIGLSVYHIVREALTNVLKHAPGSPVSVRLRQAGHQVALEVRNGAASTGPLVAVASGHGLVGLRERVAVFGGRLTAGPTGDGGFLVTATLPVEEGE